MNNQGPSSMQSVEREVREFVVQNFLFGQAGQLADDASFLESGIIDSTGVLELVGFLESRYAISIADTELVPDNLDSVQRVTSFVQRKLDAKAERVAG
jgi:acyl carrier protein